MKRSVFYLLGLFALQACNNRPSAAHGGLAGFYYPATKKGSIDSGELLRVSFVDSNAYEFKVAGNSGLGVFKNGVVSGELTGPRMHKAPFTFVKAGRDAYEFRAFQSKVELVRLSNTK